jgi:hypothetical protein
VSLYPLISYSPLLLFTAPPLALLPSLPLFLFCCPFTESPSSVLHDCWYLFFFLPPVLLVSFFLVLLLLLPPQYSIKSNPTALKMEDGLKKHVSELQQTQTITTSEEKQIQLAKRMVKRTQLLLSYDTGPQSLFFGKSASSFVFVFLSLFNPDLSLHYSQTTTTRSQPPFHSPCSCFLPLFCSTCSLGSEISSLRDHFQWHPNFKKKVTLEKVLNPFLAERFMRKWYEFKKKYSDKPFAHTPQIVFVRLLLLLPPSQIDSPSPSSLSSLLFSPSGFPGSHHSRNSISMGLRHQISQVLSKQVWQFLEGIIP